MPKERQFSRIDWGAISESFRQSCRKLGGDGGSATLGGDNLHALAKSECKLQGESKSVKFNLDEAAHDHEHDDEEDTTTTSSSSCSKRSSRPRYLLCALLLIVIVVGAVVCFITSPSDTAMSYWKAMSGSSIKEQPGIDVVAQQQQQGQQQQEMLERAEQITAACGKSSPLRRSRRISSDSTDTAGTGTSSCRQLCQNHMCCVIQDEEYSCKNDEKKECAVYAGCEALIKDTQLVVR